MSDKDPETAVAARAGASWFNAAVNMRRLADAAVKTAALRSSRTLAGNAQGGEVIQSAVTMRAWELFGTGIGA